MNEPVGPAASVVISLDSGGLGTLEAADLLKKGIATRVAVFSDPPSIEDLEFRRRGLAYVDESARQIRQLMWLGSADVLQIPRAEAGTDGEGLSLRHGATYTASDPLSSWSPGITHDEYAQ